MGTAPTGMDDRQGKRVRPLAPEHSLFSRCLMSTSWHLKRHQPLVAFEWEVGRDGLNSMRPAPMKPGKSPRRDGGGCIRCKRTTRIAITVCWEHRGKGCMAWHLMCHVRERRVRCHDALKSRCASWIGCAEPCVASQAEPWRQEPAPWSGSPDEERQSLGSGIARLPRQAMMACI